MRCMCKQENLQKTFSKAVPQLGKCEAMDAQEEEIRAGT